MEPTIKAEWARRLREEDRHQGRGVLRVYEDGVLKQCCLDILNEMGVEAGVQEAPVQRSGVYRTDDRWYYPDEDKFTGNDLVLTKAVYDWAGFKEPYADTKGDPVIKHDDSDGNLTSSATGLNDGFKYTFDEIADLIDADEDL